MKKTLTLVLMTLGITAAPMSIYATDNMSYGANLFWSGDFGGGVKIGGVHAETNDAYAAPVYGVGLQPFFDARYVEASLTLFLGGAEWAYKKDGKKLNNAATDRHDVTLFNINIDALVKYPIPLSGRDNVTVFPLAGIAYHIALWGQKNTSYSSIVETDKFDGTGIEPKATEFSALWFKFGGGFDYALNDQMYLRASLLYGFRLANSYENDFPRYQDATTPRLGHGLIMRAGIGFNM